MSQFDFGTIDPNTKTGTALASDLNSWRTALHSGHSGVARPSYVLAGTRWIDTSSSPLLVLKHFDGTDDIEIDRVHTVDNLKYLTLPFLTGAPASTVKYQLHVDETNDPLIDVQLRDHDNAAFRKLGIIDDSAWLPFSRGIPLDPAVVALPLNDTTPDVSNGQHFKSNMSAANTITAFDGGVEGQEFTLLIVDVNTTLASTLIHSGLTMPCLVGDWLRFRHDGTAFEQVAGSVGMGTRLVEVDPGDEIGDWIAITNANVYTDVDVSDDGVRKGAVAVEIRIQYTGVNTAANVFARKYGSADAGNGAFLGTVLPDASGPVKSIPKTVFLDEGGIFEAKLDASAVSATIFTAWVNAYWI